MRGALEMITMRRLVAPVTIALFAAAVTAAADPFTTTIPGQGPTNPAWTYVSDGQKTVAVKGASTPAAVGDNALVVTISPNSAGGGGGGGGGGGLNPVGAGNFATNQVSVGTTSTLIASARTGAVGTGRVAITLYNAGASTAEIGPTAGVTTSSGIKLAAGAAITLNVTTAVYGIVGTGTDEIDFVETY